MPDKKCLMQKLNQSFLATKKTSKSITCWTERLMEEVNLVPTEKIEFENCGN